jgi:hypothetical protein
MMVQLLLMTKETSCPHWGPWWERREGQLRRASKASTIFSDLGDPRRPEIT